MISNIQGSIVSSTSTDTTYVSMKVNQDTEKSTDTQVVQGKTSSLTQNTLNEVKSINEATNKEETQSSTEKQQEGKLKKKLSKDDVNEMTQALNTFMASLNCDLEFKYYDKIDRMSVRMVDQRTNETIKEFPPEELMKAMIKTKEWIGVFFDKKA